MWIQVVCFCMMLLFAPSRFVAGPPTVAAYSKDVNSAPTQVLVQKEGYKCETHTVVTEDQYIINLHRIPGGLDRPLNSSSSPVFLMHGLMGSSADFCLTGPKKGLAFLLAAQGYDVWLGNARGNVYSRLHKQFPADELRYWIFSWHEMGFYDLPASIDYVLKVTGHPKLHYIGYSMGTTVLFVLLSTRPQFNDKLCSVNALAPVAYLGNTTSPVRFVALAADILEKAGKLLGGELSPRTPLSDELLKVTCELSSIEEEFCQNIIFVMCRYSPDESDKELLLKLLGHAPAGTSIQTMIHYAQEINSKRFQRFDYGREGNRLAYNSIHPPEYNLALVTVPIAIYHSLQDTFATPKDVMKLKRSLKTPVSMYQVNQTFSHLDFAYGKGAKTLVYDLLINHLKKYEDGSIRCAKPMKRNKIGEGGGD